MKNLIKKTALTLTFAVLIGVLCVPSFAFADSTGECLFLRSENIEPAKNADGSIAAGWSVSPYPAGAYYGLLSDADGKYLGLINTNVGTSGYSSTSFATASVYLNGNNDGGEKNYYIWAAGRSESARACYIALDESEEFAKMNPIASGHGTMAWATVENNAAFSLNAGVHTLKIRVGAANSSNLMALIVTDDPDFSPIGKTYEELKALSVVDITPPQITDENSFKYIHGENGTGEICFPDVTDDASVMYFWKIGSVSGSAENENLPVSLENLKPLEKLNVEWYATDRINTVKRTYSVVVSPIEVKNLQITKDGSTEELTALTSLSAGDTVTLNASFTNRVAAEKKIKLILNLYSKDYERMIHTAEAEFTLGENEQGKPVSVSLVLPEDFDAASNILSAVIWDSESFEPYITGTEIGGAAK